MRYNPPPNWPPPPVGWQPPPGWRPPDEWGSPPPGWELWIEEPRPSVWSTLGIALGTALGAAVVLGLVFALLVGEDDLGYRMGVVFGTLLIPALLVGGLWPFLLRRAPRWIIPFAVLLLGFLLRACTVAATMSTAP